jgi:hypothetical protein
LEVACFLAPQRLVPRIVDLSYDALQVGLLVAALEMAGELDIGGQVAVLVEVPDLLCVAGCEEFGRELAEVDRQILDVPFERPVGVVVGRRIDGLG